MVPWIVGLAMPWFDPAVHLVRRVAESEFGHVKRAFIPLAQRFTTVLLDRGRMSRQRGGVVRGGAVVAGPTCGPGAGPRVVRSCPEKFWPGRSSSRSMARARVEIERGGV